MALLSLGFLLLAIMLGFIRKMNTGLLCIAFALLLGRMAGISDAEIIALVHYLWLGRPSPIFVLD